MFPYPALPPRRRPPFDGPDLHVHAHRTAPGITAGERMLVVVFLTRYVVWCREGATDRAPAECARAAA